MIQDLPIIIPPLVIRMVLTVNVRNIPNPFPLVNVLITYKHIIERVTRTPSNSLFQKRMYALVHPSLLANVVNLNGPNGALGCIAQKTAALA